MKTAGGRVAGERGRKLGGYDGGAAAAEASWAAGGASEPAGAL